MTAPHPATLPDDVLLARCSVTRGRRSGPGGQHRNKVETHVMLVHGPTGAVGQAGERRSQGDNKRVALFRLRLALALGIRAELSAPSELWTQRRSGTRIRCNPAHHDFPALLAEALDVAHAVGWEPRAAGEHLGVSASQLIKLVKQHPPALAIWNSARAEAGLNPLR